MPEIEGQINGIPDEFRSAYLSLFGLSDEAFSELQSALESSPESFKLNQTSDYISQRVRLIDSETLKKLLESIRSLLRAMDVYGIKTEDAARDIVRIVLKTQDTGLELSKAEVYHNRLASLLSNKQILFTAKAVALFTDHQNIFGSARIISDIRPVFGLDSEGTPPGGMIYHTLHFRYNLGRDIDEDFYLALDSSDLKDLKKTVEKAERKEKALITFLGGTNMAYVAPKED